METGPTAGSTKKPGALGLTWQVLGAGALAAIAILGPTDRLGRQWENDRHFLKNYRYPDWTETLAAAHMEYVLSSREANDVVILGDSTAMDAVNPIRLEATSGLSGYNLSLPGAYGIDAYLWELTLYLKTRPAPKFIVFSAHALDYGGLAPGWGELRERFASVYGLWPDGHDLGRARPFFYYAREGLRIAAGDLQGGYDHYLESRNLLFSMSHNELTARVSRQRGFVARPGRLSETNLPPSIYSVFAVSSWYAKNLAALDEIARRSGATLVLRPTPIMLRATQEDVRPWLAWLRRFAREHDSVVVSEPLILYEASLFAEAVHLNPQGAERFTDLLSQELRSLKDVQRGVQ